ncbi:MAG: type II toxin-antitoxin system VapC family toxin [Desulfobacterota bacterium]|nr:type II toxin-antitoxin system VapC family toxin [Thermodesulfobacteriota bacterium]
MKKYVLDSFALIAFFEDEPGAGKVAEVLQELLSGQARGFLSVINWGEIYYNVRREQGTAEAEKVLGQINQYPIELVAADQELTYEAAQLKAEHRIAYADCFAAALARKLNARVLTGDPEFKKFHHQIMIDWIAEKPK